MRIHEIISEKVVAKQDIRSNPKFAAWFGDSKVVDANGRPAIMYHGSFNDFPTFFRGSHFGDIEAANTRIDHVRNDRDERRFTGNQGTIYPVYLSIQNPLRIIDDGGIDDGGDLASAVNDTGVLDEDDYEELLQIVSSSSVKRELFTILRHTYGYDGLVYKNMVEGDADSWVPFDATQIKSVFNRGTYEPDNPHISEDMGGIRHVWHVTPAANVKSILTTGLKPRRGPRSRSANEAQAAVYVFGDSISLEDALSNWLLDEFEDVQLALLEIAAESNWLVQHPHRFEETINRAVPPANIKMIVRDIDEWDGKYPGTPPKGWFPDE